MLRVGPTAAWGIGNGSVGDLTWNVPGQIQPGWFEKDFNATFKDVEPPFTSGLSMATAAAAALLTTNTYVLNSFDYYIDADLSINNNETLYVAGNARLYVTGDFRMKNNFDSIITIAPGASLK